MSRIGLMADTHDHVHLIERAVRRFNADEVALVLHAGDYVSPFTVRYFRPLRARLIGVYGNNGAERATLRRLFAELHGELRGVFAETEVDGARIALLHGHEEALLRAVTTSDAYDVVVHGHTHVAGTTRCGKTLVVNPGEVCGCLTGRRSVALLDVAARHVQYVEL